MCLSFSVVIRLIELSFCFYALIHLATAAGSRLGDDVCLWCQSRGNRKRIGRVCRQAMEEEEEDNVRTGEKINVPNLVN